MNFGKHYILQVALDFGRMITVNSVITILTIYARPAILTRILAILNVAKDKGLKIFSAVHFINETPMHVTCHGQNSTLPSFYSTEPQATGRR